MLTLLTIALLAAPPDAGASPDPGPPPAPVCIKDASAVSRAVQEGFGQVAQAYADVLPGPRGQVLLKREVDRLVMDAVDVREFAAAALRDAWDEADEPTRQRWQQILANMLYKRYRTRLKDPTGHRLELGEVKLACDRATAPATLQSRETKRTRHLVFSLVHHVAEGWRVYDVKIDGTSLLRIWRDRFHSVYREGGSAAVERQMRGLAKRYPCPPGGCVE